MTRKSSTRSALSTSRGRGLVVLFLASLASLATVAACGAKATPPGPVPGLDGGAATTGDDPTSAGGGGADPGVGGGGGTGTMPSPAWTCSGDAAYRATSTAFTSPTAPSLASALDELVYAYEARPVSIVIHQDGYSRLGALSATTSQGAAMVFAAPAPALVPLEETAEGFGNLAPQPNGQLSLVDTQGPVMIALEESRWRARPDDGCGSIWVAFDAVIPASEGAKELHLGGGTATIATLAGATGAPDSGVTGYPVHAWFLGESMVFDFTSLPSSP
jgi:hypothetical protein